MTLQIKKKKKSEHYQSLTDMLHPT